MTTLDTFIWGIFPYICLVVFIGGMAWRWKTDQFGWTSRSSQLHESKILRWASPMFHVGILMVLAGHILGVLIPKSWTEAVGVSQEMYHLVATGAGGVAAVLAINDKIMLVLLAIPMGLGAFATFHHQVFGGDHGYDYRETISPWLRSLFMFNPKVDLMVDVPLDFTLHVIAGMLLIAIVPFTRLVHMFSVPVGYTTRPYVVYRSRGKSVSSAPRARGWDPVNQVRAHDSEPSEGA